MKQKTKKALIMHSHEGIEETFREAERNAPLQHTFPALVTLLISLLLTKYSFIWKVALL